MRALYDSKSKLDDRGIKQLLSEKNKYQTWLELEILLAKAQAQVGFIPQNAADEIAKIKFEDLNLERMVEIKEEVGHGFVPFLKIAVDACNPEGGKYLHYGITTQNIQQTAQLYITKQVNEIFKKFLADIFQNLANLATNHADTTMAGRTHGKHAIPITYGYKVSVWIQELLDGVERLEGSEKRIFTVMMGGAVGAFNSTGELGREVQEIMAQELAMSSMNVASRNMNQMKIEYLMNISLICNTLHKMAEEVYYTGIEEYSETSESFTKGTIGSSTMPQKVNPKLAKGIIANTQKLYSLQNVGLYSSVRVFEADSSSYMLFDGLMEEGLELVTEVLIRAEELTRTLQVNQRKLLKNANLSGGLINSEFVMMKIAEKIGKDKAHAFMYEKAMQVGKDGKSYHEILVADEFLSSLYSQVEIETMLNPINYTGLSSVIALESAEKAWIKSNSLREGNNDAI